MSGKIEILQSMSLGNVCRENRKGTAIREIADKDFMGRLWFVILRLLLLAPLLHYGLLI